MNLGLELAFPTLLGVKSSGICVNPIRLKAICGRRVLFIKKKQPVFTYRKIKVFIIVLVARPKEMQLVL